MFRVLVLVLGQYHPGLTGIASLQSSTHLVCDYIMFRAFLICELELHFQSPMRSVGQAFV